MWELVGENGSVSVFPCQTTETCIFTSYRKRALSRTPYLSTIKNAKQLCCSAAYEPVYVHGVKRILKGRCRPEGTHTITHCDYIHTYMLFTVCRTCVRRRHILHQTSKPNRCLKSQKPHLRQLANAECSCQFYHWLSHMYMSFLHSQRQWMHRKRTISIYYTVHFFCLSAASLFQFCVFIF